MIEVHNLEVQNVLTSLISAVILIMAKTHDEKFGPWSSHIRARKENNPEAAIESEKVPPPPVGPRPARLATEEAVDEHQLESQADNGQGSVHDSPKQGSFEGPDGTTPVSAV